MAEHSEALDRIGDDRSRRRRQDARRRPRSEFAAARRVHDLDGQAVPTQLFRQRKTDDTAANDEAVWHALHG